MTQTPPRSFFAEHRWLILLGMLLAFPILGTEAYKALKDNDNSVRQWLPQDNRETAEFDWFMERFTGDEIIIVSWDGCTVDDPRLEQLAKSFESESEPEPESEAESPPAESPFERIQTSDRLIGQLTSPRFGLSREQANQRLRNSFIGPDGKTGCAVLALSESGKADRHRTLSELRRVAQEQCGIPAAALHLAGPVVDNVALDVQSQQTIRKYMPLCIVFVLIGGTWALRSVLLTLQVFAISIFNALFSLALLRWCGGQMNLVLIMLPTLVYVLSISSAVHLVNYYREALHRVSPQAAVMQALKDGFKPCLFAALTTSLGLASLGMSHIAPVRDFGIYCAISMMVCFLTTFFFLPAMLELSGEKKTARPDVSHSPRLVSANPISAAVSRWICAHHDVVSLGCFAVLAVLGLGLLKTTSSVRILGNFSERHRILQDYRWLEENVGPMIPVEVILTFDETATAGTLAQVEQVRDTSASLDALEVVAGSISAATFVPDIPADSAANNLHRAVLSQRLDDAAAQFEDAGLLSAGPADKAWRISARIKAMENIDYGYFIQGLRKRIEQQLVDQQGQPLAGVKITITGVIPLVYRAQRQLLGDLATSFVTAFIIISLITAIIVKSVPGGAVAMIPNLFPVLIVFGSMGLLGIPIRISAVLTASAALGIAVDDTLHFFTWVRRAVDAGMDRAAAVKEAYARCAPAMFQTTLINGIGMLVFATTLFLPTRLFATLMFTLLAAALVGDLIFLPALLAGPLGKFLKPKSTLPRRRTPQRALSRAGEPQS